MIEKFLLFLLIFLFGINLIHAEYEDCNIYGNCFPYNDLIQNITNNIGNLTQYINQFNQSLNTTDNVTFNSLNITSGNSLFLAGTQWSKSDIFLAGFNFSTVLISSAPNQEKFGYFTIGDNSPGREIGFQVSNFNNHPNSSSYVAATNGEGFGNGFFKFSDYYYPFPSLSVYFNDKGLTKFGGYYNDSKEMNTSNSGVYFTLFSDFLTGANESVVGYQDEIQLAYYTKNNWTFFSPIYANNVSIKGNLYVQNLTKLKLTKTNNQTITNGGIWNNITFDNEPFDNNNFFDTSINNYTVNIKKTANYTLSYHIIIESADKVATSSRILYNGQMLSTSYDTTVGSKEVSENSLMNNDNMFKFNSGDTLILQVSHDNVGGSLNLHGHDTFFQLREVL